MTEFGPNISSIPNVDSVNISKQNLENLKAIYAELGITGCSFLRSLKSHESFEKGVEHALQMLTSYREYLDQAKYGNTENTDRLELVNVTK